VVEAVGFSVGPGAVRAGEPLAGAQVRAYLLEGVAGPVVLGVVGQYAVDAGDAGRGEEGGGAGEEAGAGGALFVEEDLDISQS